MILITGKSGSGKTTILNKLNFNNIFLSDEFVKNTLYKNDHKVAKKIISWWPSVSGKVKINTKKLGPILFKNKKYMNKVNKLIAPYLIKELKELPKNTIVEMAAYINNAKTYKKYFDTVILVKRNQEDLSKFDHIENIKQPISNNKIKFNYIINNNDKINNAVNQLKKIIQNY